VLASAIGGPAVAAGDKSSKSKPTHGQAKLDLAAAKQAYGDALRAFNLGVWDEAVAGFQKSYRLSGDAALLFNIAQAQRQAGHVKEAIVAYKAFLREKPGTRNREMIEAKLKVLESGAGANSTAARPEDSKGQPDGLTGIWEDPFAKRTVVPVEATPEAALATRPGVPLAPAANAVPAPPVAVPTTAAPAPPMTEHSTPQSAAVATLPAAASVAVSPLSPAGRGPAPTREEALDLRQKTTTEETAKTGSPSRWWLWTGIGAVVVAGIVTTVILSTRGPERDTSCPSGVDGCLPVGK
jgi:hypothetical protein